MFSCRFCLFCLVGILRICLCVGSSNMKKCIETDMHALLKLKDGFIDESDILSSWKGEDCCKWKGISCHNLTGHVTRLDLQSPNYSQVIGGKIDSSICELQHLTFLDLSDNNFEGNIPKCIGSLSQLIELKLSGNNFDSAIPYALGNLSNLQTLDLLANYYLVANDLEWVSHLSNLRYLDLSNVNLGRAVDWLSSISKIPSLLELRLDSCELLPQVNPKSIPHMNSSTSLKILSLSQNNLDSAIHYALGNLSNLHTLDLSDNYYLFANDLEWISHLSNLRYLDLSYTNLSRAVDWLSSISKIPFLLELKLDRCGPLPQVNPKSIPHMNSSASLKTLSLSGNYFNSSILSWVLNVSKVLTYLDLSFNSLQHSIPDGFANIISLEYLDLSSTELEGTLPKSFQSLRQLKSLLLAFNNLSGQLSDYIQQLCYAQNGIELLDLDSNPLNSGPLPDFSRLSSLKTLSLRNISVVGPLPQSFGHLPYLEYLDLSYNQLTGSLSSFRITELVSLKELFISYNQLNETLPYTIGQLSNLEFLSVFSNKLNGVITEAHLSNLSSLRILNAAQNSLSFNLSSNWVPPFQLIALYASSCKLGPYFPAWLKHQRELDVLQISNSDISDSFPKWFWNLSSSLLYLNVSHNKLSGALPKSVPSPKVGVPKKWDLSFNNLSGPLSHFPPQLRVLLLSNNMFTGSVSSSSASSLVNLTILDLSSNLLEGRLLDCWGQFQRLKVLNLEKNYFSGRIPKSLGTLQKIETIQLNNNNFSGEIPSLTHCSNLKFIDFGDNNLQGTLPAWVGNNLHHLIVLRLRANKFKGSIPASLCNLSYLQVLDLSKNNIVGEIPQCLSHIIALSSIKFPRKTISFDAVECFFYPDNGILTKGISEDTGEIIFYLERQSTEAYIYRATLAWKGENREYGKNLGLMTTIDLSCNHLTGEIPHSITTLVPLAGLNLSGNNLTGFIPNNIGHMEMLESLDLSRNQLYGRIPTSFSNLTFLSYMNLSFNSLSGKIPVSTQLDTFDASTYVGNSGLCGPQIKKQCPGDENSPNPQLTGSTDRNGTDEDEDELKTFGFYVSLGFGFIVGFWGVCGTLFFKSSWRHAYFRFFNNINDWIYVRLVVFMARMKRRFHVQD